MTEPQDAGKYQVDNDGTVQGQVIGDYATVNQYFYAPQDKVTSPAKPQRVWNIPYLRNDYFTGREEILAELRVKTIFVLLKITILTMMIIILTSGSPIPTPTLSNPPSSTSPKSFMEGYCNAVKNMKWRDIYEMETAAYQKRRTLKQIDNEITVTHIKDCELGQPPSDNSSPVYYSITFFPFNGQPHTYTETVKFDNGAWKIDGSRQDS